MQAIDPSPSSDPRASPVTLFDGAYREIMRSEVNQTQRAWLKILDEIQETNARWCARRQEMIRDSAAMLFNSRETNPADIAEAWRHWATSSAQRLVDDMVDQAGLAMKAAMTIADSAAAEQSGSAPKAKRPRRDTGETHH